MIVQLDVSGVQLPPVTRSPAIHSRVCEAILEAAADLLAEGGEPPSMNEVAEASGIARATLYRYFPNREQLLQALVTVTLDETAARLDAADLDKVPVIEGIARMTRVVVAAGSKYAAVIGQSEPAYCGDGKLRIRALMEDLMRRGIEDGTLRGDLSVDELVFVFGRLLEGAARLAAEGKAGVEHVAGLITSVFLRGTEREGFVAPVTPLPRPEA